ncbi:hypothetical protein MWU52_09235 [Jannaschia sp. S6380]|nr:hypothetical protein [Jannaschia sp. S6380]MCK0167727.1 hypothetical protein [Jannaschia sp. S6380]
MADRKGILGKLTDAAKDRLSDLLGALAPQPDAIPIPVRDRPHRRP